MTSIISSLCHLPQNPHQGSKPNKKKMPTIDKAICKGPPPPLKKTDSNQTSPKNRYKSKLSPHNTNQYIVIKHPTLPLEDSPIPTPTQSVIDFLLTDTQDESLQQHQSSLTEDLKTLLQEKDLYISHLENLVRSQNIVL